MTVQILPGVLTVSEAAAHAAVSPRFIYGEIRSGRLRAKHIGRCYRVLEEDLAAWLRDDTTDRTAS